MNAHSPNSSSSQHLLTTRIGLALLTCLAISSSAVCLGEEQPSIKFTSWITGLESPSTILPAPLNDDLLLVAQRNGVVRSIEGGTLRRRAFLDLEDAVSTKSRAGLFDVAFPKNFVADRRVYVGYIDVQGDLMVARFTVDADWRASVDSLQVVIKVVQTHQHLRGGCLLFDDEGYLLVGVGDGGSSTPEDSPALSLKSLLGKVLRIDVSQGKEYTVPATNPLFGRSYALPEIWARGLRDPSALVRTTSPLRFFAVDQREQSSPTVYELTAGANAGWPRKEEARCTEADCDTSASQAPLQPLMERPGSPRVCIPRAAIASAGGAAPHRDLFVSDCLTNAILRLGGSPPTVQETIATRSQVTALGSDSRGTLLVGTTEGEILRAEHPT